MAIVLKSNARLSPLVTPVGNLHGYSGPTDYRAMLDFTHQRYLVDGVDLSFDQTASVTRSSVGSYVDIFGRTKWAGVNEPRFSHIPESSESGILLEKAISNGCAGQTDGSAFSVGNSGEKVCLSWEGSGSVSLTAAGVTPFVTVVESGRTHVFHTRSGAISGTIAVTGDVKNVMVANTNWATSYVVYGAALSFDLMKLSPALVALVSSGTGTVLTRWVPRADDGVVARSIVGACLHNGSAPHGGLVASVALKYSGLGTSPVIVHPDNAPINGGTTVASNLNNRASAPIVGAYFSGFGAQAGIIAGGQAGQGLAADESVVPPTAFTDIYMGATPSGMVSGGVLPPGAILTHCVIYDRMVTDDEAFDMAVGWMA